MKTIVIGGSREQKIASLVLEYTIQKHTTVPVKVVHTYDTRFPDPKTPSLRSKTGFSFNRFAIPALAGYQDVAAYLECDQMVFRDVKELLSIPFDGATVLRPPNQASVLVLDCSRLKWKVQEIVDGLDARRYSYSDLMERLCIEPSDHIKCSIPNYWNSLERYDPKETALLHYTNMMIQPWRKWGHPLGHLWMAALREAVQAKKITLDVIQEDARRGHVVQEVLREAKKW